MTTTTLPECCDFVVPLRTIGGRPAFGPLREVAFRPEEGVTHFAYPLTAASFFTGPSDYDTPSDELYCPCGEILRWEDRNLGSAVELADEHIGEAHPEATAKARAARRREAAKRATQCDVYPSLQCTPKREQCQAHCIRYGGPIG